MGKVSDAGVRVNNSEPNGIAPFDAGATRLHLRTCGRQVHYAPGVCFCEAIAHHEAGHAVAVLALGLRVAVISVRGSKRYDVAYAKYSQPESKHASAVVAIAGPLAETIVTGKRSDRIDLLVLAMSPDPSKARAEAHRIVIEQESAIRRIGQALFRTPVMYEARIKALWSGKGGR